MRALHYFSDRRSPPSKHSSLSLILYHGCNFLLTVGNFLLTMKLFCLEREYFTYIWSFFACIYNRSYLLTAGKCIC